MTVERILVGVDFDAASAAAVSVAGAMADAFGASLAAAHATTVDAPPYFTPAQVESLEAEQETKRGWLADKVREFGGQHTGAIADVLIQEGPPASVLLQLAHGADLLVVGTHRFKGPQRWWLGSVAEAVVRETRTPVLVVPSGSDASQRLRPGAVILAPSAPTDAQVEEWVEALRRALVADVQRTGSIDTCPAERLRQADVVIVPLTRTDPSHASFERVIRVLKECSHPVLFVPPASV